MAERTSQPRPLALAPMEGVTGVPMRLWLALVTPPDEMGTPFLRVTRTYPTRDLPLSFAPELGPWRGAVPYRLVPQMMAARGDDFIRSAVLFGDSAPFLDLNCGCPAPVCVGKGAGSAILRDPAAFHRRIERIARTLGDGRLSVKMRLGFDAAAEFPQLLQALRGLPLARLTVHGRTRADGYRGKANWAAIALAGSTLSGTPVFASGDVVDLASYGALNAAAPLAAGTLIGRGALRDPFVFAAVRGQAVCLPATLVAPALSCFALLSELQAQAPEKLDALVLSGLFLTPLADELDGWLTMEGRLCTALGTTPTELEVSRAALGRAKMLWNYWRSSLPTAFYAPLTLRSASLAAMRMAIMTLAESYRQATGAVAFHPQYRPELDRFYAGGQNQDPAPIAPETPRPLSTAALAAVPAPMVAFLA